MGICSTNEHRGDYFDLKLFGFLVMSVEKWCQMHGWPARATLFMRELRWWQRSSPLGLLILLVMFEIGSRGAERKLQAIQGGQLDALLLQQCHNIRDELDKLRQLEESYWHARARANELRDGDKNTTYFHHKASSRKKRNFIRGLTNENGEWKDEKEDMDEIIASYFTQLFAIENPYGFEEAMRGVEMVVTREMNVSLGL